MKGRGENGVGETGICMLRFEGGTGDNTDAVGIIFFAVESHYLRDIKSY